MVGFALRGSLGRIVAVLAGIGTQLGRVMERAQAETDLREYTERLEALSRQLIAAQETERRHVARELHDEIGQALTALKLNLRAIGSNGAPESVRAMLEESLALADRSWSRCDLSLDLGPALLDDLGLVPALRWYLDRQGRRAGFATEFVADEIGDEVPWTAIRVLVPLMTASAELAEPTRRSA